MNALEIISLVVGVVLLICLGLLLSKIASKGGDYHSDEDKWNRHKW